MVDAKKRAVDSLPPFAKSTKWWLLAYFGYSADPSWALKPSALNTLVKAKLAQGSITAVIGCAETGLGFALHSGPKILFCFHANLSGSAGQHGLLTVFDELVVAHHESASLLLSRHS